MKWLALLLVVIAAGCAAPPSHPPASDSRALIASYIPASVADREAWAADIYTPMAVLEIPITPENVCAIVAVTEQESGFHVDPAIPNLPAIAHAELERRRESHGIPQMVLDAAVVLGGGWLAGDAKRLALSVLAVLALNLALVYNHRSDRYHVA